MTEPLNLFCKNFAKTAFHTFDIVLQRFREIFEDSEEGKGEDDWLLTLCQGKNTERSTL